MVLAAAESLADILERSRFGIAMAAMIRMIATTISSSINEKPFCLRILCKNSLPLGILSFVVRFVIVIDKSAANLRFEYAGCEPQCPAYFTYLFKLLIDKRLTHRNVKKCKDGNSIDFIKKMTKNVITD